jgi:hypothetical protein
MGQDDQLLHPAVAASLAEKELLKLPGVSVVDGLAQPRGDEVAR